MRAVAGHQIDVHQILRPNTDPHDYEPTADDARTIATADLVVTNPPFVVSPATDERLVYRDSGLPGDDVTAGDEKEARRRRHEFLCIEHVLYALLHDREAADWRTALSDDDSAYVELQEREFALEADGYTATRHQQEVGAGYFDAVAQAVSGGESSTLALKGSTEEAQFDESALEETEAH